MKIELKLYRKSLNGSSEMNDNTPNKYPVLPEPSERDDKTNPYGEH
jgi:hypothetical protein